MTIDLAALEDPTLAGYVQSIPLNVDPFPYADLQAQGRYPIQSTPDTIPQMLAYLAGLQAENGQGGRAGYIDDQHRLLVHDPSSGGSGLTPVTVASGGTVSATTPGGNGTATISIPRTKLLDHVNLSAFFDTGETPKNDILGCYLDFTGIGGVAIQLGLISLAATGICGQSDIVFPGGIDISNNAYWVGGHLTFQFYTNNTEVTAFLAFNGSN